MRRLLILFVVSIVTLSLSAVPAQRKTFTHRQSDGTMLTLMLVGDENLHFYLNTSTNEKMLRGQDGDFHVVSKQKFAALEKVAVERRQKSNAARFARMSANLAQANLSNGNGQRRVGQVAGSMTGSKKGLVILVNFFDKELSYTKEELNNQFNEVGYSANNHLGSVHDYFYDQSYGNFDLTFDVVGPVTVSNKLSYYGENGSDGADSHPAEMVIEACKLADAAGTNFADYDWDGDGEVDQVFVIYAGYGEAFGADSNTIWPHEWDLTSAAESDDGTGALTLDGVTVNTYACSCELANASGTTLSGIGTACHEFSHCLGFPDFYDTSYDGGFGMNGWDLMDSGSYNGPEGIGEVPAGYTSYERWCAGWLTPTELSASATIAAMKPLDDSPESYIIYNDKNANEYILLENRQNEKWFKYVANTYTTPHGLLAIHVDYDATIWSNNEPNNTANHQRMTIIPASGEYGKKKTTSGLTSYDCTEAQLQNHPFGGSSSYTELTATSNASSGGKWFTACSTGSTTLNHEVTKIANAADGTIAFLFDGGADDGSRYTVTYNAGTGVCETTSWTQTKFNEAATLPTATSPNNDWTFVGWSKKNVTTTSTRPEILAAGTEFKPEADVTLYAVYRSSETHAGSGDYELITSALEDWAGDYLIAYSSTVFADGHEGGKDGIGEAKSHVSPGDNLNGNTVKAEWGDNYHVTLEAVDGGYVMMTQDSLYNYQTSNANDIKTKGKATASLYPLTVTFVSSSDIRIAPTLTSTTDGVPVFRYNASYEMFRFYKNCSQSPVYLYKKQDTITTTTYATSPAVSTEIVISAAGYATYYNAKQAYVMPEGLKGYVINYDNGWKFENAYASGEAVPADEGLILQGSEGNYTLMYQAGSVEKQTNNMLSGTDEEIALENDADYYFYALQLGKDNATTGLYWMNADGSAFTNGAHKAFLKVKRSIFSDGAKNSGFSFDEATGISNVAVETRADGTRYNISGQRISAPLRNQLYIVNGRKFVAQ